MNSNEWINKLISILDLEKERTEPRKLVDFDITTSFAHLTGNLTVDEVFGYNRIMGLENATEGRINSLLMDYDGTIPGKEKPSANSFETQFKERDNDRMLPVLPRFFFSGTDEIPTLFQELYKEGILAGLDRNWNRIILGSGFGKDNRDLLEKRFNLLVNSIRDSASSSNNSLDFLQKLRKQFLESAGITSYGVPESTKRELFAGKLEDDLEVGFPFWKIELPKEFEAKHKSNEGTYLFLGVRNDKKLVKVNFFPNPDRFEFDKSMGERIIIPAEEAARAMARNELLPTSTLLNYIVLSPARKKENERRTRIHLAGNFMAGANGYALELLPYLNKVPGKDEVKLVCVGYDGRCTVKDKQKNWISFGPVFTHFGRKGLEKFLESDEPLSLDKGRILGEEV